VPVAAYRPQLLLFWHQLSGVMPMSAPGAYVTLARSAEARSYLSPSLVAHGSLGESIQ